MKAVILAGGLGTRLAPYTTVLPKPLMPVGDRPILDIVVRQLRHYGFDEITLAVGHLAELIMAYFGDGSSSGFASATRARRAARHRRPHRPRRGARRAVPGHERRRPDHPRLRRDDGRAPPEGCRRHLGGLPAQRADRPRCDRVRRASSARRSTSRSRRTSTGSAGASTRSTRGSRRFSRRGSGWIFPTWFGGSRRGRDVVRCHVHDGYWLDIGRVEDHQRAAEDFMTPDAFLPGGVSCPAASRSLAYARRFVARMRARRRPVCQAISDTGH